MIIPKGCLYNLCIYAMDVVHHKITTSSLLRVSAFYRRSGHRILVYLVDLAVCHRYHQMNRHLFVFILHSSIFILHSSFFLFIPALAMYIPGPLRLSSYFLPFISSPSPPAQSSPDPRTISFKPVHAHGHAFIHNASEPTLFLLDHSPSASLYAHDYPIGAFDDDYVPRLTSDTLEIRTRKKLIRRPKVRPPRIVSWAQSYRAQASNVNGIINSSSNNDDNKSLFESWLAPDLTNPSDEWSDDEVTVPDLTDRQTVITLAKMSSNAYVTPGGPGWYTLEDWNASTPFGWEPDADGLRGHVVSPRLFR